jgi:hypothetical protein
MANIKKQVRHSKMGGYLHDFGKFFVDISKLAFGSLVLGTIIRWDIPHVTTFVWGIVFTAVVATAGIILARKYEEK